MTILRRHRVSFIVAFGFICLAQYLFADTDSIFLQQPLAPTLQDLFHFDLANPENVMTGVLLLIAAAFLILRALAPYTPPGAFEAPERERPPLRSFLRRQAIILIAGLLLLALLLIQLRLADPSVGLVLVWVIALGLLVRVAYHYDKESGAPLSLGINRWDVLWIVALLVGGLIIGAYKLDSIPNSLIRDEGEFWDRAYHIAQGQETQSFFDLGVYSYPLPSSFYQAGILDVFGYSLWSWRFSSVLISVLVVIPLYLLARDMFDRRTALLAGLLMVTLPYLIAFERLGYNNAQAILPVTLMIWLLYLGLQRHSLLYFALSGVAAGLGFYTYTAGRVGIVIGGLFLGCLLLIKLLARLRRILPERKRAYGRQARRIVIAGAVFVAFALATLLPESVYTNVVAPNLSLYKTLESLFPNSFYGIAMFSADEIYRDYPSIQIGDQTFFYRPDLYARLLVRGAARSLLVFHDAALAGQQYLAAPLAAPVGVVFYFIGLLVAFRSLRQREFLLILLWWLGSIFFLSIIDTFPPRYQHIIPVIPTIALLTAVGLITTVNFIAGVAQLPASDAALSRARTWQKAVPLAILALIAAALIVTNLRNYFVEMPAEYPPAFEDVMAFDAAQLQQPLNMVYVYSDPTLADWSPWLIQHIPTQAKYQAVSTGDLINQIYRLEPEQPYRFYFDPKVEGIVATYLEQMLGVAGITPKSYTDSTNQVMGMSYSFVAPPDR